MLHKELKGNNIWRRRSISVGPYHLKSRWLCFFFLLKSCCFRVLQKTREEIERLEKEREAEMRSYKGLMITDKMTSNKDTASSNKVFWVGEKPTVSSNINDVNCRLFCSVYLLMILFSLSIIFSSILFRCS